MLVGSAPLPGLGLGWGSRGGEKAAAERRRLRDDAPENAAPPANDGAPEYAASPASAGAIVMTDTGSVT